MLGLSAAILPPSGTADTGQTAVVMVENLNLRAKPGLSGKPLTQLARATRLPIIERANGWIKVKYKTKAGYIIDDPRFVQVVAKGSGDGVSGLKQTTDQLEK